MPSLHAVSPALRLLFPGADSYAYRRRQTRVVRAGSLGIGGGEPLRVQSMTTTDSMDVEATLAQALRLAEAGCELVRITAPTVESARALGRVKEGLLRRGVDLPLAADIHFSPQAALEAAEYVEKIRINPGNFADSKSFSSRGYSEAEYARELARIEEAFLPLLEKLKRLKRALRIGANHGSLSDRILNRCGDTPAGMVESALEYARICERHGYRDLVFSMKSSSAKVTVQAYRLLAARMSEENMDYPFHLGVTEAGSGEDGRIKSAAGIGALLEDGIGDTLRVSLTEEPEAEIPVCRSLIRRFGPSAAPVSSPAADPDAYCADLFSYARRPCSTVRVGPFQIGGKEPIRVVLRLPDSSSSESFVRESLRSGLMEPEILEIEVRSPQDLSAVRALKQSLGADSARAAWLLRFHDSSLFAEGLALCDLAAFCAPDEAAWEVFVSAAAKTGRPVLASGRSAAHAVQREALCRRAKVPALVQLCGAADGRSLLHEYRLLSLRLAQAGSKAPLHLRAPVQEDGLTQTLESGILIGGLLCDGLGESVQVLSSAGPVADLRLAYDALQASGSRAVKAEIVSCPGCGRTLFALQDTAERIKKRFAHLKGVKIAVMGCVVNGPGEMADADFGYVGGAAGKINLYVGKECVHKGLEARAAEESLEALIKERGRWTDPPKKA